MRSFEGEILLTGGWCCVPQEVSMEEALAKLEGNGATGSWFLS